MKATQKVKIINDPVYGFVTVPTPLVFKLIEHPYFQRLRRITQMGLSYLVYPGAVHTRFHHALGAMFLMQKAVQNLQFKGIGISEEEAEALYIAILLHDIGHGPFSHAMENSIVQGVDHEYISLQFMETLNEEFGGKLDLAMTIFKNEYHRPFFHQLISGQLDVDRMDYLKRDSFYAGVMEGAINAQRLIAMFNVKDDKLVMEEKGIYSVEKFIIARRLMYWQVYLHKTGIVAEQLLLRLLQRAKELTKEGTALPASASLSFFLKENISKEDFSKAILKNFSKLDDYDIVSAMKAWCDVDDFVLQNISKMILGRDLLKIKMKDKPFSIEKEEKKLKRFQQKHNLSAKEASYFVFSGAISNQAYNMEKDTINLLKKSGKVVDVAKASDQLNIKALSQKVVKYYLCYPKSNY